MLRQLKNGSVTLGGVRLTWKLERNQQARAARFEQEQFQRPYRLHLGPGPNWRKPDAHWIDVDIDPVRGDLVVDFANFTAFPLPDASVDAIYGSHVFEHMSIWITDKVFAECHRVLAPSGTLRLVLPDVEKSIREYLARNESFPLFSRRKQRAREKHGRDYTLFDCLREDFLSRSSQQYLLGSQGLAHQNAWDFEAIANDLSRAGFSDVRKASYQQSISPLFAFEGTYPSEATEDDRSLYVDAVKT